MKTLVIVAHPDMKNSVINQNWVKALRADPELYTVHELYAAYPDGKIDVAYEQKLLEAHDNIILQFPIYWFSSPPLLKQWQDDVLTYGWAYGSKSGYKMKGKNVALAVSAGIRLEDFAEQGRYKYSLEEVLRPFEMTFNYINSNYLPHFGFYGTELAGEIAPEVLAQSAEDYRNFIASLV
ncbi:NAD(P)H-dependent oxidoreductase [Klebsiella sp. BIGb0407]|uniref:NAD(P)H-dependent oxidoreductase n=1 Tax=Klebsiella sp. BIGb0407 TaxID=2940603 RepID=UPI002167AF65|nr:NAD(P)H-dependent oxidoreductase [Klebsiella sp. BIGb0407]MCS3432568.1 putative NADPH-quinone reductase [Klebsiella sp. BIGb0407]